MPELKASIPIYAPVGEQTFTGERMIPGRADGATELQHWQRYRYFRPLVRGRRVLDVACGEGYGSHYLAGEASEVLGVDISREAIEHAKTQYVRPNLSYRAGDAQEVAALGTFDAIVSFETIEHVPDPRRFLAECRAALAPGGFLVVSTPNRALVSGGSARPLNPFHTMEWTLAEYKALIEERFPHVQWFRQSPTAPWDVAPECSEKDLFFVAVCGVDPVAPVAAPFLRPTGLVIVCHDNLAYSKLCLQSVAQFTPEPIEIVIVDNGSADGTGAWTVALQKSFANVRVIANGENRGFAPAVNQGLALLAGRDVLLLNNDIVVTPGWLGRQLMVLREDSRTGVVGPLCNYAADPQRIQMPPYDRDYAKMISLAVQMAGRYYGRGFEAPRLSGFCALIRSELVERIGGLDERFVPGFFEDDDFTLRARLAGFRLRVAADVFVHHFGSVTFRQVVQDPRSPLQLNWERFKAKWDLPGDLAMGSFYPCDKIGVRAFDPQRDYIPLPCSASA